MGHEWLGRYSVVSRISLFGKYLPMSTALFLQYAPDGFVIAADGRSTKEDTGEITGDSVQKIFKIDGPTRKLAYAMTGALKLESPSGEVSVNLAEETTKAINSFSEIDAPSLLEFARTIFGKVYQVVKDAHAAGRIAQLPAMSQPEEPGDVGETILKTIICGYFHGRASFVRVRLFHKNNAVKEPDVIDEDIRKTWMSGIADVSMSLFSGQPSIYQHYAPYVPKHRMPNMAEIIYMARQYIKACGSPEALKTNPHVANTIGGRTLIATITPGDGFSWVKGFEPLPSVASPNP